MLLDIALNSICLAIAHLKIGIQMQLVLVAFQNLFGPLDVVIDRLPRNFKFFGNLAKRIVIGIVKLNIFVLFFWSAMADKTQTVH